MIASAVVLAAGRGARLGGVAKALLWARDGDSFLAAIVHTAAAAGIAAAGIVVVVGPPFGDAVAAEARRLGAQVAVNPTPEQGMASSVAVGFAALRLLRLGHRSGLVGSDEDVALLWPVDHPAVTVETVRALLAASAGLDVVVPRHGGVGGHPAVVSCATWPALAGCAGLDDGARAVLRDRRWRRADLDIADPAVVRDVDTPDALGAER